MSRLHEPARKKAIKALTDCIQASQAETGFFDSERLAIQQSLLEKKLQSIAKSLSIARTPFHLVGISADGVPGLERFFEWRTRGDSERQRLRRNFEAEGSAEERQSIRAEHQQLAVTLEAAADKLDRAIDDVNRHNLSGPRKSKSGVEQARGQARELREEITRLEDASVDEWLSRNPATILEPTLLAEDIVTEFESWPHLYDFIVPLPFPRPLFEPIFEGRCQLSEEVRIEILSDQDLKPIRNLHWPHWPSQSSLQEFTYADNFYVLRASIRGYHLYGEADPLGRIHSVTRQFLGLAIATGMIDCGTPSHSPKVQFWENCIDLGTMSHSELNASGLAVPGPLEASSDTLNQEESAVIESLTLASAYGGTRLWDADSFSTSGDEAKGWLADAARFRTAIKEIGFAFRSNERLVSAGEWLFDSYVGQNQALQLVQAMTTLEILFGGTKTEQEHIGLTKLLANRCAYLLGARQAERTEIEREVKDLYEVRSLIVHSGMRRLPDESVLDRARALSKRAIKRELRFLVPQES